MIALQLAFTRAPFMNGLFHSAPIGGGAWARIALVAVSGYAVVEMAEVGPPPPRRAERGAWLPAAASASVRVGSPPCSTAATTRMRAA
ncbi:MAG: hypothetical protein ACRD03_18030 [Acidimicrobiales bacterium]